MATTNNRRRFENKICLVTGSSTGIGYGICKKFAEEGGTVIISSRKQNNVDAAVQKLRALGLDAHGCVCHVSKKDHRQNLFNFIKEKFGRLDILVPNAAVSTHFGTVLEITEKAFDKIIDVNLKSVFFMIKEFMPLIPKGGGELFCRFHLFYRFLRL